MTQSERQTIFDTARDTVLAILKVLSWEATAMSRYAQYREDVRGILDDFRRTGIGYGA